jgi:hypothetical protein
MLRHCGSDGAVSLRAFYEEAVAYHQCPARGRVAVSDRGRRGRRPERQILMKDQHHSSRDT